MIFEQLTTDDVDLIQNYINFEAPSQGEEPQGQQVPLSHILRIWKRNKEVYLYPMFNNNLILSKHVSLQKNPYLIIKEMKKALESSATAQMFTLKYYFQLVELGLENSGLQELTKAETLVSNIYTGPKLKMVTPDNKILKIEPGCKVIRILSHIAKAFDLKFFEEFRLVHSQVLNQKALKGKLSISIHPMDYMTISDNDNDWDSCTSWRNKGGYRSGTVEMMNSPNIVVAYLESETPMDLGYGKWNNKKWRQLFIVDENIIVGVKGYPYHSDDLTTIVVEWLRELATAAGINDYSKEVIKTISKDQDFFVPEFGNKPFRLDIETHHIYSDFDDDHFGVIGENAPSIISCEYSSDLSCVHCGSLLHGYDGIYLLCDSCSGLCEEDMYDSEK